MCGTAHLYSQIRKFSDQGEYIPLGVLWPWGVNLALFLSDLGSVSVKEVTFYLLSQPAKVE